MQRDSENESVSEYLRGAIQSEASRTLGSSLKSSQNAITLLEDMHQSTAYSLMALTQQSEKITLIEDTIHKIEDKANQADIKVRELQGVKGWFPRIKIPLPKFKKRRPLSASTSKTPSRDSDEALMDEQLQYSATKLKAIADTVADAPMFQTVPDSEEPDGIRRQIDENLDSISSSLRMLKLASQAMGAEIDEQTDRIAGIGNATARVNGAVALVNGRLRGIAK
ncbi:hypothetical protein BC830DRAFT_1092833 [Chytriomyces sp. MP71]|nr:hypothetical protein BC830DRAFT_1092833 [Chytriomyces sp. MP71]